MITKDARAIDEAYGDFDEHFYSMVWGPTKLVTLADLARRPKKRKKKRRKKRKAKA